MTSVDIASCAMQIHVLKSVDERQAKMWKPKVIVLGDKNKLINRRGI